jgi:hypothetical protein
MASVDLTGQISSVLALGMGINASLNLFIYAWKHNETGKYMQKSLQISVL